MNVLIIDDKQAWIDRGAALLELVGCRVTGIEVTDSVPYTKKYLPAELLRAIREADVLLVDNDFGDGVTSSRFICMVRHHFKKLVLIRWASVPTEMSVMDYLGVTCIFKPTKRRESGFLTDFQQAIKTQKIILSGPLGIFDLLNNPTEQKQRTHQRSEHLRVVAQIAQLAHVDVVRPDEDEWWEYELAITGRAGEVTRQKLSYCVCDGFLDEEDLLPYLSDLQAVVAKFRAVGEIDPHFEACAELIDSGDLSRMELCYHCY